MIGYIKSLQENKRKEARELELREALARKVENFDNTPSKNGDDETEYTLIEIGGKVLSVAKEKITIFDIDAPPLET